MWSVFLMCYQAEWLLWGFVWREHHWRVWGLHWWCVWDVWAPPSSKRSLQDNWQSAGERLPAGLLHRCKCWTHFIKSTPVSFHAKRLILRCTNHVLYKHRSPVPLTWRLLHSRSLWKATPTQSLGWRRSVCCCLLDWASFLVSAWPWKLWF